MGEIIVSVIIPIVIAILAIGIQAAGIIGTIKLIKYFIRKGKEGLKA